MPWGIAAAAVIGAGASIYGANKASDAQSKAAAAAQQLEQDQFKQTRADFEPYRAAGQSALERYADALGINGDDRRSQFQAGFRQDPGYQFAFDEGQRAVQGSAAARGGLISGGAMRGLTRFGQGLGDQQYGSYLDRYMNLAQMGQASTAQVASAGALSSGRQGQYLMDAGAARAGGYLSAAEGVNGALSNAMKLYGQYKGWNNPTPSGGVYNNPDGADSTSPWLLY